MRTTLDRVPTGGVELAGLLPDAMKLCVAPGFPAFMKNVLPALLQQGYAMYICSGSQQQEAAMIV
jgi:hypothetical protein